MNTLVHPSLSSTSDFLGYEQPRPTAPFPYSNAWGNNIALYLPFFVLAWFGRDAGWRRKVAPIVLVAAIFPITYSLNRGLWISLAVAAPSTPWSASPRTAGRALQVLVAGVLVGGIVFVSSPLYDTLLLRVETPHSNDRRAAPVTVVEVTARGLSARGLRHHPQDAGQLRSLAGGETDECHQCAAPPLGTQGFMWRLILTTGFVGTVLCLRPSSAAVPAPGPGASPLDVTTCTVLLVAVLCFFVYDSLGSAMFTALIAIGLMARADEPTTAEETPMTRDRRHDASASYAAEVARLLWPEPWEAPYVTRSRHRSGPPHRDAYLFPSERRPRLLVPADVPGSSSMLQRLGRGRSALVGPDAQPARALRPLAGLPAGPVADAPRPAHGPGRRLDRDTT